MNKGLLAKLGVFLVVAGIFCAMEVGTLTGPHTGTVHTYRAIFGKTDGVSGLYAGNTVRVSGVDVGKVTDVRLLDATHAQVTFTANENQTLTTSTWAVVKYANLLGQRFLALTQAGAAPGAPLPVGATIPMTRTAPALSLTALFNGFRPLFAALTPEQVNRLSGDIIDVLQGQSGAIDSLVSQTADLTANLANRDQTFTQVIDSLSSLLTTVSKHDNQLAAVVTSVHTLTSKLQTDGPAILDSLGSVDKLIGSVGGLFDQLEDHNLPGDIADLNSVTGVLAENSATVGKLITGFGQAFGDFARITQNGNWANVYLCNVNVVTYGTVQVTGANGVEALKDNQIISMLNQALGGNALNALLGSLGSSLSSLMAIQIPLQLPNGVVGAGTAHTKVCQ
ncbi:MAG: MCE family protein [Jatrophihabitantaceae bacterium]